MHQKEEKGLLEQPKRDCIKDIAESVWQIGQEDIWINAN